MVRNDSNDGFLCLAAHAVSETRKQASYPLLALTSQEKQAFSSINVSSVTDDRVVPRKTHKLSWCVLPPLSLSLSLYVSLSVDRKPPLPSPAAAALGLSSVVFRLPLICSV